MLVSPDIGEGTAGGWFGRVLSDGGDLGREEDHLRVADDDGCEGAVCVELTDEVEDVLAGHIVVFGEQICELC
jgi:hypothetical protein